MKLEFDPRNPVPVARIYIIGLMFLTLFQMYGWQARESQQMFFVCGIIALVALFLRNLWITGFVLWTVLLFIINRMTGGQVYLSNIFFGSVLYLFSRMVFKESEKYLNVFMWFVVANLWLSVCQVFNLDFIYRTVNYTKESGFVGFTENNQTIGLMGFQSAFGMLCAMAIPVIMTRPWRLAFLLGVGMFIPIYLSSSSISVAAGMAAFIFSIWNNPQVLGKFSKYKKRIIAGILALFILGGIGYAKFKDDNISSYDARLQQWKLVLQDCQTHPIVGWGLDSFRNVDAEKTWQYARGATKLGDGSGYSADIWDNPHNIWVSLQFEWGFFGVILVLGYLVDLTRRYLKSWRLPDQTAIFGLMVSVMILGTAHFPMFLARFMVFIIPMAAILENSFERQNAQY